MPRWQSIIHGELPGWDSSDEEEDDNEDGDQDDHDRPVGTQGRVTPGKDARRGASKRSHGGYSSAGDDDGPSEG